MALIFPREMPSLCRITAVTLRLEYQQARALPGGGTPQVVDLGPALWTGQWTVEAQTAIEAGQWSAWLSSLRGGRRTFRATARRRWPLSHPRGFSGTGWAGVGAISTIDVTRDRIGLTGLLPSLTLLPGDHVSIVAGPRQHLHHVTEGGTASITGNLAITVEPPLHAAAIVGAAVRVDTPWTEMVLREAPSIVTASRGGTITFVGQQVLI